MLFEDQRAKLRGKSRQMVPSSGRAGEAGRVFRDRKRSQMERATACRGCHLVAAFTTAGGASVGVTVGLGRFRVRVTLDG